ncbi:hypothetical protein HDG33_001742 [Paraburkholderia sp. Cpub6]|nr:hypothetical protein [Paraburkholderia sp. Cpub6]
MKAGSNDSLVKIRLMAAGYLPPWLMMPMSTEYSLTAPSFVPTSVPLARSKKATRRWIGAVGAS